MNNLTQNNFMPVYLAGNWIKEEDEMILKYVYEREMNGDSMMWG